MPYRVKFSTHSYARIPNPCTNGATIGPGVARAHSFPTKLKARLWILRRCAKRCVPAPDRYTIVRAR